MKLTQTSTNQLLNKLFEDINNLPVGHYKKFNIDIALLGAMVTENIVFETFFVTKQNDHRFCILCYDELVFIGHINTENNTIEGFYSSDNTSSFRETSSNSIFGISKKSQKIEKDFKKQVLGCYVEA